MKANVINENTYTFLERSASEIACDKTARNYRVSRTTIAECVESSTFMRRSSEKNMCSINYIERADFIYPLSDFG